MKNVCIFFILMVFLINGTANGDTMSQDKFQNALLKQNQIHHYIKVARQYEKKQQYDLALKNYLEAYQINQCAGLIAVCRGGLANSYEALRENEKALEHIEWFLSSLNEKEPLFKKMQETKQRLLKKIEEEKTKEPMGNFKENVRKLTPDDQKKFVQSLSNDNIMGQFKKAMTAEQQKDFSGAMSIYESLLGQKEQVVKEMGIHAWVMLYPGIQRTAEFSKNEGKEKEALAWIKENLFNPQGVYHSSLPYLEKRVVSHLEDRVKKLAV